MQEHFLPYKKSRIHYRQWGHQGPLLVCLHGYGETAQSFVALAEVLCNRYQIIAPDLPHHGLSRWNENTLVNTEDLLQIIQLFTGDENFALLGYSMGGRMALQLYQLIPEQITRLFLLAPDGLTVNTWYWLATQNKMGNQLFKHFMKQPGLFFMGIELMKKLGWINKGSYNYAMQFLKQEPLRTQLYNIWTAYKNIKPNLRQIRRFINRYQTTTRLIYGKHDYIIKNSTAKNITKSCEDFCTVHILPCGHRLLQEKNVAAIADIITHSKPPVQ